jgi:hypothetical protein
MGSQSAAFISLNLCGGVAVLASYAVSIIGWPEASAKLWGQLPETMIPYYTANMFVAAFGYFLFTWRALRCSSAGGHRFVAGRGFGVVLASYAATLIASALWMPLSLYALLHEAQAMYWLILVDLAVVAAGSLGILACMLTMSPAGSRRQRVASIVGACMFCSQTVLLDFVIWPRFFTLSG